MQYRLARQRRPSSRLGRLTPRSHCYADSATLVSVALDRGHPGAATISGPKYIATPVRVALHPGFEDVLAPAEAHVHRDS